MAVFRTEFSGLIDSEKDSYEWKFISGDVQKLVNKKSQLYLTVDGESNVILTGNVGEDPNQKWRLIQRKQARPESS
jgi:hypothetical protein